MCNAALIARHKESLCSITCFIATWHENNSDVHSTFFVCFHGFTNLLEQARIQFVTVPSWVGIVATSDDLRLRPVTLVMICSYDVQKSYSWKRILEKSTNIPLLKVKSKIVPVPNWLFY
jgi:hypothetical protein